MMIPPSWPCSIYNTVERLQLRLQICLNVTAVTICLNFELVVYFVETQVEQPKIIKTCA